MNKHKFGTMEHQNIDDDMGFVMVDQSMVFDTVDKYPDYVKVENADAGMDYESEDSDMTYETDEDTEYYEMTDKDPSPKGNQGMEVKDIVKGIVLPFLPAKSLARFRSVSKEWDRCIRNPFFGHRQSHFFKRLSGFFCQFSPGRHTFVSLDNAAYGVPLHSLEFLPEPVSLLSSCNGLLLCHARNVPAPYYVCNPVTREWGRLPPPQLFHGDEPSAVLAFEPSALNMEAHYQLLCAIREPTSDHNILFELYSSETNYWRVSETTLLGMDNFSFKGSGFYMNGVAYMETTSRKVIAFHLSSEMYEVMSLPPGTPRDGVLTQVRGELCYVGLYHKSKNKYSVIICSGMGLCSKRRQYIKIGQDSESVPRYQILPSLDGDNIMILVGNDIYFYSTSDGSLKVAVAEVEAVASGGGAATYLAYVNSLVQVAKPN